MTGFSGSIENTPMMLVDTYADEQHSATTSADRMRANFELPSRSAGSTPTVSVVVCTRNRADELRQCLQCISELIPPADEVLVVDNSSGDADTEHLAELFGARYVLERVPGLSRARNRALLECRSEVVAYLDDDCRPDPLWLEYLLRPFSDSQVAVVAGEIIRFTGRYRPLPARRSGNREMRYVTQETPRWFEIASFGGIGSGGNMALRKQACLNPILFDERLGRGAPLRIAEENCAFASLLAKGHATVRLPTAVVYHPAKPLNVDQEAKSTISYWLLLFEKFPDNRLDLLYFLTRRVLRKPVAWRMESQAAGNIVSSGWPVKFKALFAGFALFFRVRRFRPAEAETVSLSAITGLSGARGRFPSTVAP